MHRTRLPRALGVALSLALMLPMVPRTAPRIAEFDVRCPLFGHKFTAQATVAAEEEGEEFAAFDSDLCKRPVGPSGYRLAVWTCPYCFFSAYQPEFLSPLDARFRSMELRSYRLENPAEVEQWDIFIGIKFHNAEIFYREAGKDAWFLADLMRRGTYACRVSTVREPSGFESLREELVSEAWPRETRFGVEDVNLALAAHVRQLLASGELAPEQVPLHRYILADALRQAGDHGETVAILDEILEARSLPESFLKNARTKLLLSIKENDFQGKALAYLKEAHDEGIVPREERAVAVYMLGELSRRQGAPGDALRYYEAAAELVTDQEWLSNLIVRQTARLEADAQPDPPPENP
jgi:tetratricopeptide (TPR) repeat protein